MDRRETAVAIGYVILHTDHNYALGYNSPPPRMFRRE
jgi:hypothetical protein